MCLTAAYSTARYNISVPHRSIRHCWVQHYYASPQHMTVLGTAPVCLTAALLMLCPFTMDPLDGTWIRDGACCMEACRLVRPPKGIAPTHCSMDRQTDRQMEQHLAGSKWRGSESSGVLASYDAMLQEMPPQAAVQLHGHDMQQ